MFFYLETLTWINFRRYCNVNKIFYYLGLLLICFSHWKVCIAALYFLLSATQISEKRKVLADELDCVCQLRSQTYLSNHSIQRFFCNHIWVSNWLVYLLCKIFQRSLIPGCIHHRNWILSNRNTCFVAHFLFFRSSDVMKKNHIESGEISWNFSFFLLGKVLPHRCGIPTIVLVFV